jgi:Ni/Co efflux regulator RcnB
MKHFLKNTASIGLALALTAPMALAQNAPDPQHPHAAEKAKTHVNGNHDKVVNQDKTVERKTVINQARPPSPWAPNHDFLPGHAPGDNRLPIYTQQGLHNEGYPGGARAWHRGDRYDGPREVVTDYDHYHVGRPPAGYEYVRNGDQLVLIAVASGVIADVLANALTR